MPICSQETCLTEEMGLRVRPYICGVVTGRAAPPAAEGKQFFALQHLPKAVLQAIVR